MNDNDFDIIRSVLNGQVNHYKTLVERYQSAIFHLLIQMVQHHDEAKGLTQEVFVKAYENLDKFNFKSKFFSWIYRIAINTAITYRKQQQRFVGIEELPQQMVKPVEEKMLAREKSTLLKKAVSKLADKYQSVIVLRYFEQLSYAEMAEILNITEKKVKSRLFDARKMLKTLLEESGYF